MLSEIGLLKTYSFRNVGMKSNPLMLQGYFVPDPCQLGSSGRLGPYSWLYQLVVSNLTSSNPYTKGVQLQAVDIRESIK